jgi:hypothetical protein
MLKSMLETFVRSIYQEGVAATGNSFASILFWIMFPDRLCCGM